VDFYGSCTSVPVRLSRACITLSRKLLKAGRGIHYVANSHRINYLFTARYLNWSLSISGNVATKKHG